MAGSAVSGDYSPYITLTPASNEPTHTLVGERFKLAQEYADKTFNTALDVMNQFPDVAVDFAWEPQEPVDTEFPPSLAGLEPVDPTDPVINEITVTPVEFPHSAPTITVSQITPVEIPNWDVELPNFITSVVPTTEVPAFTTSAPPESSIVIPGWTEQDLPPLPVLTEILPPDEPEYNMPVFEGTLPIDDLTPPDMLFSWNEAEYSSDVLTALQTKVLDGIVNGGAGMSEEIEQAIYDRAISRLNVELQKSENLALEDFASRGSRLPQGALIARFQEIQLQNILAREDLTNDVMVKSADQAYQYSTFIIEKGINLEHEVMAITNNAQQRAFDSAKAVIEYAIKIYDSRVQAYSIKMEAYKVEAQVFEAKIRAEMAKAELYRSILDGRKLSLEMQALTVELYSKQVQSVEVLARIYSIQMEGAKTEAEIERIKIDRYRALIDSYSAQVGAVTAEYDLYQAKLTGESEKAKLYMYQADGYKTRIDAVKVESDIDIANLQAELDRSRGEREIFITQLEKYKVDLTANVSNAEIQAKAEGLKLDMFTGNIQKFDTIAKSLTESYKAKTNVDIANAGVDIQYGEILAKLELASKEITASLIQAQAQIASQLSASALSSVSAGANLGYSQNRSDSTSSNDSDIDSNTQSTSHGSSTSKIFTYMEKCCGD